MATYAEQIAAYVTGLAYDDLPVEVIGQAKTVLLDAVACAVGGAKLGKAWVEAALGVARDQGGADKATILYFGDRTSELNAAFVNGILFHSMYFSDDLGGVQIGGIVQPVALALAESRGAGGREVIAALVIGYDVASRLAEAADSQALYSRGLQPTAWLGGYAAAATAGRLLGLSTAQMASAFGIAASFAGGSIEFLQEGTDTKRLHPAKCAQTGLLAALLAEQGMTGPRSIFEGGFGVFRTMSEGTDFDALTAELGTRFEILNTSIKPLPFCDGNLAPLEGVLSIMHDHGVGAADIARIHCRVIPSLIPYVFELHGDRSRKLRPVTDLDAQMSLPYCLAVGIRSGGLVRLEDFDKSHYDDPEIANLAGKVTVEGDHALLGDRACPITLSSAVSLWTTDGRRFDREVRHQHGDPRNPMTQEDMAAKFRSAVQGALSDSQTAEALAAIGRLEHLADLCGLMRHLVRGSG
jgi:2-methylcitrate dehydratase PrpD